METPPTFFYNPNAYQLGIIEQRVITCDCCGKVRDFAYTGNFYSTASVGAICPWCIADGSAAEKYNGSFVSDFEGVNPDPSEPASPPMSAASIEQVDAHTPGYTSWQGAVWLGHCGDACIFLGYVGSQELAPIWNEVQPDIIASYEEEELVRECLHKDGDMTGYLFCCQHCGRHRLHIDAN